MRKPRNHAAHTPSLASSIAKFFGQQAGTRLGSAQFTITGPTRIDLKGQVQQPGQGPISSALRRAATSWNQTGVLGQGAASGEGEAAAAAGGGEAMGAVAGAAVGAVGALAGFVVALIAGVKSLKSLSDQAVESRRDIGRFSGTIAVALAKLDVQDVLLKKQMAEKTSGSAAPLFGCCAHTSRGRSATGPGCHHALEFVVVRGQRSDRQSRTVV